MSSGTAAQPPCQDPTDTAMSYAQVRNLVESLVQPVACIVHPSDSQANET
jgi:hypothetical protein